MVIIVLRQGRPEEVGKEDTFFSWEVLRGPSGDVNVYVFGLVRKYMGIFENVAFSKCLGHSFTAKLRFRKTNLLETLCSVFTCWQGKRSFSPLLCVVIYFAQDTVLCNGRHNQTSAGVNVAHPIFLLAYTYIQLISHYVDDQMHPD